MALSANPTSALLLFFVLTVLYIIVDYREASTLRENKSSSSTTYLIIYALAVIISEYVSNLSLTNQLCGSNQYLTALTVTVIPWTFMFGTIVTLINVFPGWLSPFSNTFGYAAALASGLNDTLNDILEPKFSSNGTLQKDQAMMEALTHIYSDRSMLINEVTPDNFSTFWKEMSPLMRSTVNEPKNDLKQSLFSLVVLKDSVAKLVWYVLAGVLVISVGYNYLINTGCSQSADEMQKRHSEYEQQLANENAIKQKAAASQRVYSTSE
jgi:hypothetical protein